ACFRARAADHHRPARITLRLSEQSVPMLRDAEQNLRFACAADALFAGEGYVETGIAKRLENRLSGQYWNRPSGPGQFDQKTAFDGRLFDRLEIFDMGTLRGQAGSDRFECRHHRTRTATVEMRSGLPRGDQRRNV